MQHWSWQDSCPIVQCCCANKQLDLLRFRFSQVCSDATPMHCSTVQGKTAAPLFKDALQTKVTACLCHCNYTHKGFLFTQVCSCATPMHCRTGQGKTASPLFSAALQNRLTACLCHCNIEGSSSHRCAVMQRPCTAELVRARQLSHCSVLLCKPD